MSIISQYKDNPLAGRDFLRMLDLTPEEFRLVLDTAYSEKQRFAFDPKSAEREAPYQGKAVSIILEKPSLRTRVSFERAVWRLGAQAVVMSDSTSAFSRDESIKDTMMVLERYVDALVIRSFEQARVEEIAHWASMPVVNALTDDFHPCQGLADFFTIEEVFGKLEGLKLAYFGDGANNMAHTYLEGGALAGMHVTIASPKEYQPVPAYLAEARATALQTGAVLEVTDKIEEALDGADVIVTDAWASMGFESEHEQRAALLDAYQVKESFFDLAKPGAVFMHCLPAHRGEEVTDAVMDASYSCIYQEAENRMHVQQALLLLLLADG
ncbi:MAG: ornithine carbamoyltransferase [Coriobacteriia bacterium]|nr:ornithine carbamoyltransferase [Coriobacteriia bacterium]